MNPHVQRKHRLQELEGIAWAHFIHLLENEQIPEDDAKRITVGVLGGPRKIRKSLTVKVSLLPPPKPEEEMSVNGYPIDNHWDTKPLCLQEIDIETAAVTVTIVNEMPWLRQDMSKYGARKK